MSEKIDYSKGVYDAKKLGTGRMFILGVQHMFAMFGAFQHVVNPVRKIFPCKVAKSFSKSAIRGFSSSELYFSTVRKMFSPTL